MHGRLEADKPPEESTWAEFDGMHSDVRTEGLTVSIVGNDHSQAKRMATSVADAVDQQVMSDAEGIDLDPAGRVELYCHGAASSDVDMVRQAANMISHMLREHHKLEILLKQVLDPCSNFPISLYFSRSCSIPTVSDSVLSAKPQSKFQEAMENGLRVLEFGDSPGHVSLGPMHILRIRMMQTIERAAIEVFSNPLVHLLPTPDAPAEAHAWLLASRFEIDRCPIPKNPGSFLANLPSFNPLQTQSANWEAATQAAKELSPLLDRIYPQRYESTNQTPLPPVERSVCLE